MVGSDKMSRDILSHFLCSINGALTRNIFSSLKNKNATLRDFKV